MQAFFPGISKNSMVKIVQKLSEKRKNSIKYAKTHKYEIFRRRPKCFESKNGAFGAKFQNFVQECHFSCENGTFYKEKCHNSLKTATFC